MNNLGWASRIVLGVIALIVLVVIGAGVYYMVVRSQRSGPLEVEQYPGTETLIDNEVQDGLSHQRYAGTTEIGNVAAYAQQIEKFYRDQGFTCVTQTGETVENGTAVDNTYLQSTCLMDRSHPFGFDQSVRMIIQPERTTPDQGGALTGRVVIDVQRTWGSYAVIGG